MAKIILTYTYAANEDITNEDVIVKKDSFILSDKLTILDLLKEFGLRNYFLKRELQLELSDEHSQLNLNAYGPYILGKTDLLYVNACKRKEYSTFIDPFDILFEYNRLIEVIKKSNQEVILLNIGSKPQGTHDAYQEYPEFAKQVHEQTLSIDVINIDPRYASEQDNKFKIELNPMHLLCRELIKHLNNKLAQGKRIIIFDNTYRQLSQFSLNFGISNHRHIHKQLEIISGYGMYYENDIPVILCGAKLFSLYQHVNLEDYTQVYVDNSQVLRQKDIDAEVPEFVVNDQNIMSELKNRLKQETGSLLFLTPAEINLKHLFVDKPITYNEEQNEIKPVSLGLIM